MIDCKWLRYLTFQQLRKNKLQKFQQQKIRFLPIFNYFKLKVLSMEIVIINTFLRGKKFLNVRSYDMLSKLSSNMTPLKQDHKIFSLSRQILKNVICLNRQGWFLFFHHFFLEAAKARCETLHLVSRTACTSGEITNKVARRERIEHMTQGQPAW